MWRPSKITLIILIILMSLLGAISIGFIDWESFDNGYRNALRELRLTIVFWGLGVYFLFPYVKKIKESQNL